MRNKEQKKAYDRAYYLAHREHIIARSKANHAANQERTNQRQKDYFHRRYKWGRVPGWTKDLYFDVLRKQDGRCAICKNKMAPPVRDHDHATNLPRGLLCHSCNRMLGAAKDNIQTLASGIHYLKEIGLVQ